MSDNELLENTLRLGPSDELDDIIAARVMSWRERNTKWHTGNVG